MESRKIINILGIDPSLRGTGLGIISLDGRKVAHVWSKTIHIRQSVRFAEALFIVSQRVRQIIPQYCVKCAAIETPPFAKSASVLRKLSGMYGAVVEALEEYQVPCYEFTPGEIKESSTGYGRAEKFAVQNYIKSIFGLEVVPESDSADALACALTLANQYNQLVPTKLKRL